MKTSAPASTADLSPAERSLLRTIRVVGFGHLVGMTVNNGQPLLSSATVIHHHKLNQPAVEVKAAHDGYFLLKDEFVRLFEIMRGLESATVLRIEVRHGLPALIEVVMATAEADS